MHIIVYEEVNKVSEPQEAKRGKKNQPNTIYISAPIAI